MYFYEISQNYVLLKIRISPNLTVIGIPESEKFLLVKSRSLGSGIQNAVIGNPESR